MLKVHNEADSNPAVQYAEAQNALLHELASAGLPVPAPLPLVAQRSSPEASSSDGSGPSADGRTLRIRAEDGCLHAVRLLTYLPGTLLVDAPQVGSACRCLLGWDELPMPLRLACLLPQPRHTALLLHPSYLPVTEDVPAAGRAAGPRQPPSGCGRVGLGRHTGAAPRL